MFVKNKMVQTTTDEFYKVALTNSILFMGGGILADLARDATVLEKWNQPNF